ncbi:MAG: uroporphyrinogen decarboxylase family protein [Victivallales bacterium]
MNMLSRENILRAIRFESPEFIPMRIWVNPACWHHYDQEALKDLLESHPLLFPDYRRPQGKVIPDYAPNAIAGKPYTDAWGCIWNTTDSGITGSVHTHPLDNWEGFDNYRMPDPETTDGTYPIDWDHIKRSTEKAKEKGDPTMLGLPHGHCFLRLQDIRGYQNLMFDMVDEEPRFLKLLSMIQEFDCRFVAKCAELQPDIISLPEDLGMQSGPMISPVHFRKFIKPIYRKCMDIARRSGCIVHMHSDGDIRTLVDDLVDAGVDVINLQDLVNGIDWIAGRFAGKKCIELDIDRQSITRFGTPSQIDALIREEVERLSTPQGGLMMIFGMYPGIPLENAKALMDAMERYCQHVRIQ